MQAWKANQNIDFNFTDCQLHSEINSENEQYIKRKCRERINMAGKYAMLIGQDTKSKHKYVRWEAEVAIEKKCTIIGVNLDGSKSMKMNTCPLLSPVWNRAKITVLNEATCFKRRTSASQYRRAAKTPT